MSKNTNTNINWQQIEKVAQNLKLDLNVLRNVRGLSPQVIANVSLESLKNIRVHTATIFYFAACGRLKELFEQNQRLSKLSLAQKKDLAMLNTNHIQIPLVLYSLVFGHIEEFNWLVKEANIDLQKDYKFPANHLAYANMDLWTVAAFFNLLDGRLNQFNEMVQTDNRIIEKLQENKFPANHPEFANMELWTVAAYSNLREGILDQFNEMVHADNKIIKKLQDNKFPANHPEYANMELWTVGAYNTLRDGKLNQFNEMRKLDNEIINKLQANKLPANHRDYPNMDLWTVAAYMNLRDGRLDKFNEIRKLDNEIIKKLQVNKFPANHPSFANQRLIDVLLCEASSRGNFEISKILLENGADTTINIKGLNAYSCAKTPEIKNIIIEYVKKDPSKYQNGKGLLASMNIHPPVINNPGVGSVGIAPGSSVSGINQAPSPAPQARNSTPPAAPLFLNQAPAPQTMPNNIAQGPFEQRLTVAEKEIGSLKALLAEKEQLLKEKDQRIQEKDQRIQEKDQLILSQREQIAELKKKLDGAKEKLKKRKREEAVQLSSSSSSSNMPQAVVIPQPILANGFSSSLSAFQPPMYNNVPNANLGYVAPDAIPNNQGNIENGSKRQKNNDNQYFSR